MRYPDIYFEPGYARLYAKDGAEAVEYIYRSELGAVSNLFLKRPIDETEAYYDIITPYGYGGPRITELAPGADKQRLIAGYMDDFASYAGKKGIVSEFVRFHPILGNGVDFHEVYNSTLDRQTVGTDLTYDDVFQSEITRQARKNIRHLLSDPAVRYEVDDHPKSLSDFLSVYYSTMDRNGAGDSYYFGEDYFAEMLRSFPEHLMTVKVFYSERLIAMCLCFRYGDVIHIHLSGTVAEYLHLSPAYVLRYAVIEYGKNNGYRLVHSGGGRTGSAEDTLYKYKKQFGKNTSFDFYLGRKIWNETVYKQLCQRRGVSLDTAFFPAYRA